MRAVFALGLLLLTTATVMGQTETLPAIAREVYAPKPEVRVTPLPAAIVPAAPVRAVTERVVTEAPPAPVAVAERAVVREQAVTPGGVVTWWDAFARNRYGYYDDSYLDDNWYYDYYELPKAAAVIVDRSVTAVPGHRTTWIYEPLAERGLFSW